MALNPGGYLWEKFYFLLKNDFATSFPSKSQLLFSKLEEKSTFIFETRRKVDFYFWDFEEKLFLHNFSFYFCYTYFLTLFSE